MADAAQPPPDSPQPPSSGRDARRQAKADLAAAKARAKAERPFWKKPWFWIVAVIVIAVVGSLAGGGDDTGTTGDTAAGDGAETTGIGQPAADGQFTFTVNDIECGETKLGNNQFLRTEAQGQFCIVDLTVENTGNESQTMFGDNQYLYIGDKQYSADTDAIFAVKEAEKLFAEEINPGNTVTGWVVFDIPAGGEPDRLELHDSAFSGGVIVNL